MLVVPNGLELEGLPGLEENHGDAINHEKLNKIKKNSKDFLDEFENGIFGFFGKIWRSFITRMKEFRLKKRCVLNERLRLKA